MCYPVSKLCPRLIANCAQTARSTLLLIKNGLELWSCSVIHCSVYYPAIKCVQLPGYYVSSMCFVPPHSRVSRLFHPQVQQWIGWCKDESSCWQTHRRPTERAQRGWLDDRLPFAVDMEWIRWVYSFAALTLPLLSCAALVAT